MKKQKTLFLALLVGIMAFSTAFVACDDDDDSFWYTIATVNPVNVDSFYFVLDDGITTLYPTQSKVSGYKPEKEQRAYIEYDILKDKGVVYDQEIRLRYIQNILTKGIIDLTAETEDSIGNDAIKIFDTWIGDDYLNIRFGYNAGGDITHMINLVDNKTKTPPADGKIYLELRHNTKGDPQYYGVNGFVAFDLRPYKEKGEVVTFNIEALDFNGEIRHFEQKYDPNKKQERKKINKLSERYNKYVN